MNFKIIIINSFFKKKRWAKFNVLKNFLLINIKIEIVFNIFYLKFDNKNILFIKIKIIWKCYIINKKKIYKILLKIFLLFIQLFKN